MGAQVQKLKHEVSDGQRLLTEAIECFSEAAKGDAFWYGQVVKLLKQAQNNATVWQRNLSIEEMKNDSEDGHEE